MCDDQTVLFFRKGRDARMIPPIKLRGTRRAGFELQGRRAAAARLVYKLGCNLVADPGVRVTRLRQRAPRITYVCAPCSMHVSAGRSAQLLCGKCGGAMLQKITPPPDPARHLDTADHEAARLAGAVAMLAAAPDRTGVMDLLWRARLQFREIRRLNTVGTKSCIVSCGSCRMNLQR